MKVGEAERAACPCCGQSSLVPTACRACGGVVLVCAAVGTVFPARPALAIHDARASDDRCPACAAPLR